jgi:predicted ATPase
LTSRHPVLMILEDAHWSDPSTLEMLGRSVKSIASLRVLFVVTFRPEFEPTWIGQSHVTALNISRLTRREVDIMIDKPVFAKTSWSVAMAFHYSSRKSQRPYWRLATR